MKAEERKDFHKSAGQWDTNLSRVHMAQGVAAAIVAEVNPTKDMAVLDFGCGTGLLTLNLQPLVRTITGADSSPDMLAVLEGKIKDQGLTNVRTVLMDFEKGDRIVEKFNLVVCNMVLHHVPDTAPLFRMWHEMLLPGGRLCLSDLDTEDGSFHSDKTGVFHFGFDRERLQELLRSAGFSTARAVTAASVAREVKGKEASEFSLFLIVADQ